MTSGVEPLSGLAWARIELDVFARLDAEHVLPNATAVSSSWWLVLPVALSTLAVAARMPPSRPRIELDGQWSRVTTGASSSRVTFDDADVTLDPQSAVVFERDAVVWLERGAGHFSVAPHPPDKPFVVLVGRTLVRTRDAQLRIAIEGERTSVAVARGDAEVHDRGAIVHVAVGQTWGSTR